MQRSYQRFAGAALLVMMQIACGDDDPATDAGQDANDETSRAGRGGKGGSGGRGGAGGRDEQDSGTGDEQAITIRFKAKVGNDDFECGRNYAGQGSKGTAVRPRDLRFFVEDVRLIARGGREVPVELDTRAPVQTSDVAIVDFAELAAGCSAGGNLRNLTINGRVPAGDYTGITFSNAVPERLNHQNIATASPPLQDTSTYWGGASGYRFILAEVATEAPPGSEPDDADGGSGPRFGPTVLHIGSAGCTGSTTNGFTCSRPYRNRVKLDGYDPDSSTIVADLGAVFRNVDLSTPLECHGADPECASAYAAFGLDTADGGALSSQSVFRIE
jgi:uncharacterized repeat protein (TIGR04052 family)